MVSDTNKDWNCMFKIKECLFTSSQSLDWKDLSISFIFDYSLQLRHFRLSLHLTNNHHNSLFLTNNSILIKMLFRDPRPMLEQFPMLFPTMLVLSWMLEQQLLVKSKKCRRIDKEIFWTGFMSWQGSCSSSVSSTFIAVLYDSLLLLDLDSPCISTKTELDRQSWWRGQF